LRSNRLSDGPVYEADPVLRELLAHRLLGIVSDPITFKRLLHIR
jgi:hypothetical protein